MITPANLLLMACAEQKRPDRMWVTRIINAEQFDNIAAVKPYAPSGFTLAAYFITPTRLMTGCLRRE